MSRTKKPSRAKVAKQRRLARKAYEQAVKAQTRLLDATPEPKGNPVP